jgi:acetylornithine deacetylase/succinyl-diaminopimelate desuccinylase-like protein
MAVHSMTPSPRSLPVDAFSVAPHELAYDARVRQAMEWFTAEEPLFTQWQIELGRIPAPPFHEDARAMWLAQQFENLGMPEVQRDEIGNVIAVRPGKASSVISISAHIDTVFPADTGLNIGQQGARLYGPGVSDNAAGVAALLAIAAAFQKFQLPHAASLLFIGNVGEEGEGDLRGMRHIFQNSPWKDKIEASVIVDGAGADTIVAEALGSRRFEVILRGPGGHSWSDFGAANPIVALSHAIHLFSQVRVPNSPKTTFNVGVVEGGTSVNSIPESARMRVDIRSASSMEIERLEMELRRAVEHAVEEEDARARHSSNTQSRTQLRAEFRAIGNRPAGQLPPNARILQIARAVDAYLGNSAHVQRASTDANIPLSLGREAIAIGAGGQGGGAHTLQEWFDVGGRELALKRILLIALALAATHSTGDAK